MSLMQVLGLGLLSTFLGFLGGCVLLLLLMFAGGGEREPAWVNAPLDWHDPAIMDCAAGEWDKSVPCAH